MKKNLIKMFVPAVSIGLILLGGCIAQPEQSIQEDDLTMVTATENVLPPVATLGATRTPLPTATPEPTEILPTATVEVSGFQRMIRSMPTAEFVAGFYPDSVEIVYADSLVPFVNNAFGYQTAMEPGIYYEKTLKIEDQFGYTNIYHPAPDYILTIFSGLKPVEEKNTPQELLEGSHGAQAQHAAQYGLFEIEESEIIELDGDVFAYSRIVVPSVNGYLEFLALTGYRPHAQADLIVEFALTGGYLRATMDELDSQHEELLTRMKEIISAYQYFETDGEVQIDYTLYTGVCPTDTDDSYGYSQENPIRMVVLPEEEMDQVFVGPFMANAYFETLLVDGQAVQFVRQGSTETEETILDI